MNTKKKSLIKGTTHCHLARQLSIIKQAEVNEKAQAGEEGLHGNVMADIIAKLKYDPIDFGMSCRIPITVHQPLLELGLTDSNALMICHGKKPVFLSSDTLCLKFGKHVISKRHKLSTD